jgi:glutathione S-transferase
MLKLYGGARSRASIVRWYLEEINVPYEFILLDLPAGEHRQPDYLKINPFGKVPAIVDGDFKLWESGAILLYLAEKYGKIPDSLEERAEITQWVFLANSTLATGLFVETSREREMPKLLTALEQILQVQTFLMGEEFSVADVAVGSLLGFASMMLGLDFSEYPAVVNYSQRLAQRPACMKAIAPQAAPA